MSTVKELRERYANKRYLFIFNGVRKWLTFEQAYREIDSGWTGSIDGGLAINIAEDTIVERKLSDQEKADINYCADESSAAK